MAASNKYIRRIVNIGLGGTGIASLLHAKRALESIYGEVPPSVAFLGIDGDDQKGLQVGDDVSRLPAENFLRLEAQGALARVTSDEEIKAWWPTMGAANYANGAGGLRAAGKLYLYLNSGEVTKRADAALDYVRRPELVRGELGDYLLPEGNDVTVNIACSLAGGTGSGMFLTIAKLLRAKLQQDADQICAYFLLPDIFNSKPGLNKYAEINTYAALLELEAAMDTLAVGESERFRFGTFSQAIKKAPFDRIFLLNRANQKGTTYTSVEDLNELVGLGMAISVGEAGRGAESSNRNNSGAGAAAPTLWKGRTPRYSSFGVAELVTTGDYQARCLLWKIAGDLLAKAFGAGHEQDFSAEANEFLGKHRLREQDGHDDLIDSVLTPGTHARLVGFNSENLRDWAKQVTEDIRKLSDRNREDVRASAERVLKVSQGRVGDELRKKICQPGGVAWAKGLLPILYGKLRSAHQEMLREQAQHQDSLAKYREERAKFSKDLAAQLARTRLFAKPGPPAQKVFELGNAEIDAAMEIERRAAAARVFEGIMHDVEELQGQVSRIAEKADRLREQVACEEGNAVRADKAMRPFTLPIAPTVKNAPVSEERAAEFLRWMETEKKFSVLQLSERKDDQVLQDLEEFLQQDRALQDVRAMTISASLDGESLEDLKKRLRQLAQTAQPMWSWDPGAATATETTSKLAILLQSDSSRAVFSEELVKAALPNQVPDLQPQADSKRVIVYIEEGTIPPFALDGIQSYREKYLDHREQREKSQQRFTPHTHKDYDLNRLPGLCLEDKNNEADALRTWAWAITDYFGLIRHTGAKYQVKRAEGAEANGDWSDLARGRQEAFEKLALDEDLLQELEKAMEKKLDIDGKATVAAAMEEGLKKLQSRAEGAGADLKEFFGKEIRAFKARNSDLA